MNLLLLHMILTCIQDLELHHGLNPDLNAHIWLLHHLFLGALNEDAKEWAEAWNAHTISIRGERQRSPRDLFFFGMIQNGLRGLDQQGLDDSDENVEGYGIDWDAYDDYRIRNHLTEENESDGPIDNPFIPHQPHHLSHIEVDEADCPLTPPQLQYLDSHLEELGQTKSMDGRRTLWITALDICERMFS
jgi:hypothetical protein